VIDLDSDRDSIKDVAIIQGRILGATKDEVEAAIETAYRALQHHVMQKASLVSSKGKCRREVPVAIRIDDRVVVEGVVDLAFEDETGGWTVVDYKTDFEIEGRLKHYEDQVRLYAHAISKATNSPVRGVLLRI
jgi:ATP-dependent exoDNAse (exonuclease V) beta subunit